MNVEIIDPARERRWNEQVQAIGGACVFHTAEWAATLSDAYGFRPLFLVSRDRGDIQVCLPLMEARSVLTGTRGVSLPFTDFCPPLCPSTHAATLPPLVNAAHDMGARARWKYVEWRSMFAIAPHATPFRNYLTHTLSLSGTHRELFSRFKGPARTAVRKAETSGLRVSSSSAEAGLRAFYRLHGLTRRDHGLPPPPYAFFRALHRHVFQAGLGRVVLAEYNGMAVAGAVFLHFGDAALFKYGASDKRHQALRGGNLVMWEAMRQYNQEGYAELNLGRTSPAHEGLLRFKRGWSPTESRLAYYRFEPLQRRFVAGADESEGLQNRIFRRLPMTLLKACGRLLYKHAA